MGAAAVLRRRQKLLVESTSTLVSSEAVPSIVSILPIDEPLFPGGVLPIDLLRARDLALVEDAVRDRIPVGGLCLRNPAIQDAGPDDLFAVGTIARIAGLSARGAALSLELQGTRRFRITEFTQKSPYLKARVQLLDEAANNDSATQKLALDLRARAPDVLRREPNVSGEALRRIEQLRHAGQLADMVAGHMGLTLEEQQLVLQTADVRKRLKLVVALAKRRRQALGGYGWPNANVWSYALISIVLGVYLYTGAIAWDAVYGYPLVAIEGLAVLGLLRETVRWLK